MVKNFAPVPALLALALAAATACGDNLSPPPGSEDPSTVDKDQDGFISGEEADCNDENRFVFPGAAERCDGVDNDCDGLVDEDFDLDDDGFSTCAGDCRDNDDRTFPGAPDLPDGYDNNCDGGVDNNSTTNDDDGDGYSEEDGDCNDDLGQGGDLVGPRAIEVQLDADGNPEGIDNDCDGIIDEALEPCPEDGDSQDPLAHANAMDACHFLKRATWATNLNINTRSRAIRLGFGDTYVPFTGSELSVLSTGIAADRNDPMFREPQTGTAFFNVVSHPDPMGPIGCSDADEAEVNDYTEVLLTLEVPSNAVGFSFNFNFMSVEFPEYVCTSFDDTFLALLESDAFTGNVVFDSMGNRMSINVGFFDVCNPTHDPNCTGADDLIGTGHESNGGGTGWLQTSAPVLPGEKIRLRFVIFDEGDHILDSTVLIDSFRWDAVPVECPDGSPPPCTIESVREGRDWMITPPVTRRLSPALHP